MTIDRLATSLIDRYRIERELGQGGMAIVYLAEDLRHHRKVAIKVLRPELAAVIGAERFVREIQTIAALQHPHILGLIDSGEVSGSAYYVMPFVEGESLRDRLIREKQLPINDAVRIATEVASALDYAHRHGVIHRDIKPENILLHDGSALVADFGIALAVSQAGGTRMTETGMSLGTPHYMSPEQAMGQREITARSDVYALGCVTYEMLVGEPPFTGPTTQAIVAKVMTEDPKPLVAQRRSIPSQVEDAVLTALEKLPADRYPGAAPFAAALTGDQPGARIRQRTGVGHRARSSANKRYWLGLASGLLVGGVATWAATWTSESHVRSAEPRQWAVVFDDSLPMYTPLDEYGTASRAFDLSRDGQMLVYASESALGVRLISLNLETGTSTIIRGSAGARTPTFSPDGSAIAAIVGDSEVRRYSLTDGSTIRVSPGSTSAMTWHPNGRLYYDGGCWSSSSNGGEISHPIQPACRSNWVSSEMAPIPSNPDWVLLHVLGSISVASLSTGEVRPLTRPDGQKADTALLRGSSPTLVAPGYLVFLNGNTLLAAPFDSRQLRLTGAPQPVLSNIRREQSAAAQLAISDDGTLVWNSGADGSVARFAWVGRDGVVLDTLRFIPPVEVGSYALTDDGRRLAYDAVAANGTATLMVADLNREVVDRFPYPYRLDPVAWIERTRSLSAIMFRPDGTVRPAIVHFESSAPEVDTTVAALDIESHDGSLQCRVGIYANTVKLPTTIVRRTEPHDSMALGPDDLGCSFTSDGQFVLWAGADGLFVASTKPLDRNRRVRVASGTVEPKWSPDGREIQYRMQNAWYAVSAPRQNLKPAGPPRLLFRGDFLQAYASWDRSPDGRFLLLVGEPPVLQTHLNVMTNFGRYLESKLGKAR